MSVFRSAEKGFGDAKTIPVVHIITKLELGGAQLNTLYTVENMDRKEFTSHLISGKGGLLDNRGRQATRWHPVDHLVREIRPWKDFKAFFAIRNQLRRIRPAVVHTHSAKGGVLGRLAGRSAGVPIIIHTYHGFSFSTSHSPFIRGAYRLAERILAPLTDHLIFVSSEDKRLAQKMKLEAAGQSLIRSGFDLERFTPSPRMKKKLHVRFDIPEHKLVCGTVAPFKPQKGLTRWLEVAEKVIREYPDVCFLIAGDGAQRAYLETEISRRNLTDSIRLPGFITDIHRIMNLFDIGLTTALWEGLPQSIVQMRLMRIPVVASDIPGHREIIKDKRNGYLVDVKDTNRFADRILLLLTDPQVRRQLANHPEDFTDWDAGRMVEDQEHLYRTLLALRDQRHHGCKK